LRPDRINGIHLESPQGHEALRFVFAPALDRFATIIPRVALQEVEK